MFFLSLTISSCALQTNVVKSLITVKNSFVKVETLIKVKTCLSEDDSETCDPYATFSSGSGVVTFYKNRKAILTAAHVCRTNKFGSVFGSVKEQDIALRVIDRENKQFYVNVIKYDVDLDICLMDAPDIIGPGVRISTKAPEYAERVYNVAAPLGIAEGNMVPVYEGFFFGEDSGRSFYSIPTIGGSSGSPILNVRGELVGMIHSVHYRFHHISLSVTHRDLWNFLSSPHNHTSKSQNMCLHSDSGRIQIEEPL